jgi:hypothetical protein
MDRLKHRYPDVWIACSHNDKHSATELTEALDALGIMTTQFSDVTPGHSFSDFVEVSQSASRVLVCLVSRAFQASFEIKLKPWLTILGRYRDPTIFPVQVDVAPDTLTGQLKALSTIHFFDAKRGMQDALKRGLAQFIADEVRRQRVFICHASGDRGRIEEFLSTHELGSANIWFDSRKVPKGIEVSIGIRAGIDRASRFLAFATPNFVSRLGTSEWLQLEIALALERELRTPGFAALYALEWPTRPGQINSVFRWVESPSKEFIQKFLSGDDLRTA